MKQVDTKVYPRHRQRSGRIGSKEKLWIAMRRAVGRGWQNKATGPRTHKANFSCNEKHERLKHEDGDPSFQLLPRTALSSVVRHKTCFVLGPDTALASGRWVCPITSCEARLGPPVDAGSDKLGVFGRQASW